MDRLQELGSLLEIALVFIAFPGLAAYVAKGTAGRRIGWAIATAVVGLIASSLIFVLTGEKPGASIVAVLAVGTVMCCLAVPQQPNKT